MVKILTGILISLLSHICYCNPTITEYYDLNEVNKISLLELQRSRFELALQSNLQISEYGMFDFSHPLNGRSIRIAGILLPRDIEVYLRILSSPVLHNPPYNLSLGSDERLMRHLGFVKGVVRLSRFGAAYQMIERILRNHISSLTHIKDFHKPKQAWPTYLDNRAAYANLWKHATNLFTVKLDAGNKGYYYQIDGEIYVFKYHIFFDKIKFQALALLLGYWNSDKVSIPDYLIRYFDKEMNNVDRSNYPLEFFAKVEDLDLDLNRNKLYKKFYKDAYRERDYETIWKESGYRRGFHDSKETSTDFLKDKRSTFDSDEPESIDLTDGSETVSEKLNPTKLNNFSVKGSNPNLEIVNRQTQSRNLSYGMLEFDTSYTTPRQELNSLFKMYSIKQNHPENDKKTEPVYNKPNSEPIHTNYEADVTLRDPYENYEMNQNEYESDVYEKISLVDWVGGLTWDEAMKNESKRVARVLIKILYKMTRNMMKSHEIDVELIERRRTILYKTSNYSKSIKLLRNMLNTFRLLFSRFDDILMDEDAEEILFESGSKYKMYWNLKNDSLYNKRTVSDRSIHDLDQNILEILIFEPNKFYNKLINITGDSINFRQVYDILLALTQDTTPFVPKSIFNTPNSGPNSSNMYSGKKYVPSLRNKLVSKRVTNKVDKVLEQYQSLHPSTNSMLRGRAKCLMAFLYLFGVSDTSGNTDFPNGWPRNIKKSLNLLISGMSSPCGLCNTLLGFLASIGFPPVSNNMYAWETRRNDEETTVYQLISANLYKSFLRKNTSEDPIKSNPEKTRKSIPFPSLNKSNKEEVKSVGSTGTTSQGPKKTESTTNTKDIKTKQDSNLIQTSGVVDRSGYDLPLLCYLSGSYKNDELSSLAYSYYIHSGIGNPSRTCEKSAQSSINRSPKNVGLMCLDAIPYAIESAKSSMKNKHDQIHDTSEEYKSRRYAEFIKKLSHMGDSDGLRMMGDFYYTGHEQGGIARNYQQAINFWSRAAESGDASSALAIAHHHLSNLPTDDSGHSALQAERYLRMVINSSSPNTSTFSTANFYLYRHGLGQPRDPGLAARYLRESADRGDVNSMVLMGHAYAGILTDVTPPEGRNIFMSFYYYRRAAQSGNIVGLFNSAVFTLHGYDLEYTNALDRCNEAYKLFSRVARMGTMSTVLKVLSKRAKTSNDKIGHVLTNMMLSELGDSNAHRELTKHFKNNSVFCYTENLDPDITQPTTLFSSKNTKSVEHMAETTPHTNNTPMGNMGSLNASQQFTAQGYTQGFTSTQGYNSTQSYNQGHSSRSRDRNEINRMSREIRMLNMVRVTEQPDDPEHDLRTRGIWSREEPQNVSIFESLIKSSNNSTLKNSEFNKQDNSKSLNKDKDDLNTKDNNYTLEDEYKNLNNEKDFENNKELQKKREGSCYYYYSRRGAYSPQNSTPLLLAEALLSGKPWLPSEALFWAKRSKESESLKGSYMYATMLEAGLGAPKNCQISFKIFKEFMSGKSRGERILGLVCILRNKIISKIRHPQFLYSFLVKFLYDSYVYNNITNDTYVPCDYTFVEFDKLPPVGLRLLSLIYMTLILFTLYVYFKVVRH